MNNRALYFLSIIDLKLQTYAYDGSLDGFLTAVFEVFERKPFQVKIVRDSRYQPDAFADRLDIVTDEEKVRRLWQGLHKKISVQGLQRLYACYLSELPDFEMILLKFIQRVFDSKENIETDFSFDPVLQMSQISRKFYREKHRFEAFVRFQQQADNVFYAGIEPDFNVLPLISSHFSRRYADQEWIIYDMKRRYGIYYDKKTVQEVQFEFSAENRQGGASAEIYDKKEAFYQMLWQGYFKHVNIPERKNLKLQRRHIPLRYVKYMAEITD